MEVLAGVSHVYPPDSLNSSLLLRAMSLNMAPTAGMWGRTYALRKDKEGDEELLIAQVQLTVSQWS